MDWLSKHRAIVDCDKKTIRLKCFDLSEVKVHGIQSRAVSNVISTIQARRLCDAPKPGGLLTTHQPAETLVNVG